MWSAEAARRRQASGWLDRNSLVCSDR